jgi:hypothetical protein
MIDKINDIFASREVISYLKSNWLRGGWSSTSRVRVEIVLSNCGSFYHSTDMVKTISVDRMSDYSDAVEVVLQDRREAHWYDHWTIKDMWDKWMEFMKFYR